MTFNNLLASVPNEIITISISVSFMFHIFFNSLSRSRYSSFFSLSYSFIQWSANKVHNFVGSPFFIDYYDVWPRLGDHFLYQSPIGICVRHSPAQVLGCAYTIGSYGQI